MRHEGFSIGNDYDISIIKECQYYFKMLDAFGLDVRGKTVLDIGAHRGFFTRLVVKAGAKRVIAVEPEKENFKFLKRNANESGGDVCIHGAVVGWDDEKTIPLTVAKKIYDGSTKKIRNSTAYSVVRSRGGQSVVVEEVKAYPFKQLVKKYKPQFIKLDCQGVEWSFFMDEIGPSVECMFGEIHYSGRFLVTKDRRMHKSPLRSAFFTERMLKPLRDQGFELNFSQAREWKQHPPYGGSFRHQNFVFLRR